jgi:hypothetical protein
MRSHKKYLGYRNGKSYSNPKVRIEFLFSKHGKVMIV